MSLSNTMLQPRLPWHCLQLRSPLRVCHYISTHIPHRTIHASVSQHHPNPTNKHINIYHIFPIHDITRRSILPYINMSVLPSSRTLFQHNKHFTTASASCPATSLSAVTPPRPPPPSPPPRIVAAAAASTEIASAQNTDISASKIWSNLYSSQHNTVSNKHLSPHHCDVYLINHSPTAVEHCKRIMDWCCHGTSHSLSSSSVSSYTKPYSGWWRGGGCDRVVAVDSEGLQLGRFGKLCVLQICVGRTVLVCDALQPSVVEAFRPLLTSPAITKVCHDCREDNSALYHQYGLSMKNVFDTQVAHTQVLAAQRELLYQSSMVELLRDYISVVDNKMNLSVKEMMSKDPCLWLNRPLSQDLARYAIFGVMHLPQLMAKLVDRLLTLKCDPRDVVRESRQYTRYRLLNANFKSAAQIASRGSVIQGLMASRSDHRLILKLNCGRTAVVSTPAAMSRFNDVKLGDIADLVVSTVSVDGSVVYVDRHDPMYDYWNLKRRPRQRHSTALSFDETARGDDSDPMLCPFLSCEDPDNAQDSDEDYH
eukprot:GHVQ01022144.1.p1 GENE.GHVQ01022144.1~~GHVQ01022144.1.p1  ORF type:complete len:537 (+),score=77.35 GHVQ01022144.1:108-1718(+)